MTEEEYFRKNYPDSCYGDKPLSPYWDFFQDGVEFGERESEEKKIEELEKRVWRQKKKMVERTKKISDLEKENAELKADNDARKFAMAMSEKVEKKLRQENNKAKEIIKKLKALYLSPVVTKDDVKRQDEILAEAEQFLNSEVGK